MYIAAPFQISNIINKGIVRQLNNSASFYYSYSGPHGRTTRSNQLHREKLLTSSTDTSILFISDIPIIKSAVG